MEKNMGFGLVLGLWAVLKTAQPKLLLATFEDNFLCFYGKKKIVLKILQRPH